MLAPSGDIFTGGTLYYGSGSSFSSYDLWFKTYVSVPTPATHLNFDGVNDYVNLGTSISTALNGATALTFEAWINPSVLNGWNNIITDYDGAYHKVLLRVRNNNNIQFVLNGTFLNSPFSVPLNTWTHIAAVYDGANMYVYANGTLIASQAASVSLPTTSNQFNIGNRISGSELFTGNIDEVRVWTTARTVEQINGSMNCELQGTESGLVAYYQFNQGIDQADNTSVTTLTDATSNGYDGTLTNFALTGSTSNWLAGSAVTTGSTVPVAPTVATPVVYNQNATATALTATTGGTGLLWYTSATGGTGSATAPIPDTSTLGTTSYWVSSTNANGCESERMELVVNVLSPATHLNFDGADDYIAIGANPIFDFANNDFTLEAYIYRAISGTDDCIIGKDNWASNNGYSFWILSSDKLVLRFGSTTYSSTMSVPSSTFTHVAATYDSVNNEVSLYINGVLDSTHPSGDPILNTGSLYIGTPQDAVANSTYGFSGSIDDLRIWNTLRSETELNGFMNCELQGTENGLLAYYKFNQGSDQADNTTVTTVTDATANANNGTLVNFALTGATSNWLAGSPLGIAPQVTTQPQDQTITETDSLTFTVAATGATSYQWEVSTDGGSTWMALNDNFANPDVSGSTTNTLTVSGNNMIMVNGYLFRVLIGGTAICTIPSDSALATVTLGTETFSANGKEVTIYPNPFRNEIIVDLLHITTTGTSLEIYDSNGRLLKDQKLSTTQNRIDMHDLPSGLYLFRIISDERTWTQKVIKQ
ncbi:hypothetical protein DI487_09845 [Flavobacterium sediminis]|uniref:LamG-like jellyroll fold domain-containing protein n=1 Tax=Flavobacterium sediminis TaxID=2201181 RepID=A0A2U8QV92_9FLAO|nr:LamG-like jellyroll fold domain-containing protein [Flavobacterium sediminis]AWM14120.1 hypothetical protein DI487_09845 [Flavobacterium sediminis]